MAGWIRTAGRTGALPLAALVAAACSAGGTGPGDDAALLAEDARFSGEIVVEPAQAPNPDALAGIWIAAEQPGSGPDQIGLVVWESTVIVVQEGGSLRDGSLEDLRRGRLVRAWTTDVEYLSIPPQYDATRLEVVVDE